MRSCLTPQRLAAIARARGKVWVVSEEGVGVYSPVRLDGDALTVASPLGGAEKVVPLSSAFEAVHDARRASHCTPEAAPEERHNPPDQVGRVYGGGVEVEGGVLAALKK